jgi:hypothetical protein
MDVVYQAEDSELGRFVALGANEVPRFLPCNDFFTVEVLSWRGLLTYYVLFFIHLESHRVSKLQVSNACATQRSLDRAVVFCCQLDLSMFWSINQEI